MKNKINLYFFLCTLFLNACGGNGTDSTNIVMPDILITSPSSFIVSENKTSIGIASGTTINSPNVLSYLSYEFFYLDPKFSSQIFSRDLHFFLACGVCGLLPVLIEYILAGTDGFNDD